MEANYALVQDHIADFFEKEIAEVRFEIRNERIWERGSEDLPNVHTQNIVDMEKYICALSQLKSQSAGVIANMICNE
ncbi:hypothetical protein [Agathobaculum desmolans]|uniref:hypothetical protein n=1 Tax=Agathobaculum desmolans TaxID=39484 RepID=UPI00248D4D1F|nr:hypothetical protein [Agathobaculum desmolans]